jgi:hypothetical protein
MIQPQKEAKSIASKHAPRKKKRLHCFGFVVGATNGAYGQTSSLRRGNKQHE